MSTAGKETRPLRRDDTTSPTAKPPRPPREKSAAAGPPTWARVLGTILIVWHLVWVFLCPLANSTKVNSTIGAVVSHWLPRLYTDPLFINVGYGFFSPDPPFSSPILEYKVYGDDGRVKAEGRIPDPERMFPRLRYHRHKMLADQGIDTMIDPERPAFVLKGFARHLIREHDGQRAEITEIAHDILPLDAWRGDPGTTEPGPDGQPPRPERKGIPLDDPSTYRTIRTITQSRADVERFDAARNPQPSEQPPVETLSPGRVQ